MNMKLDKLPTDILQTHLEGIKDQDQEFNDHFAPIYQAEQEKPSFITPSMQIDGHRNNNANSLENKQLLMDNNSFFIMQQKQLLQRDLTQNQRITSNNDCQKQMKIVMSEPKFLNPFPMSNSNPNLRQGLNIPLKHEPSMNIIHNNNNNNNMNNNNNSQNNEENDNSALRKQKGNVKNTYIKKINSLMNLSRIEDAHQHQHQQPPKYDLNYFLY